KEVGDKYGKGNAYGNLGNAYHRLEIGDKHGEGNAYGSLGNAYFSLAIECHNLALEIAKEVGDKHREGNTYGNLGNAYCSLAEWKVNFRNQHKVAHTGLWRVLVEQ
ncbi:hypothetical protein pdam_00025594, partial [Pocillopora damicornis]